MSRNDKLTPALTRTEVVSLDPSLLHKLTEEELDAAEDEGLGGNVQYQDLQACDLDDLRIAVAREGVALRKMLAATNRAAAEEAYIASRPSDDEHMALWHLDLGVAAATVALIVIGAHPFLSCNGGAFGTPHSFDRPVIALYLEEADLKTLTNLADSLGIELSICDGKILMQAIRIEAFHEMAVRILARFGSDPTPGPTIDGDD